MFQGFVDRAGVYADSDTRCLLSNRHLTHSVGGFVDRHNHTSVHKMLELGFDCIFTWLGQGVCTLNQWVSTLDSCEVYLLARECARCFLEGVWKELNLVMFRWRCCIYKFELVIVHCDEIHFCTALPLSKRGQIPCWQWQSLLWTFSLWSDSWLLFCIYWGLAKRLSSTCGGSPFQGKCGCFKLRAWAGYIQYSHSQFAISPASCWPPFHRRWVDCQVGLCWRSDPDQS